VASNDSARPSQSAWAALWLILIAAFALRLWRLDANGFGTEYYAAGVRSMLESPRAFFFNAFDPFGYVSLDKPPVAFWLQVLSAGILGYSGFTLALPQVLEGVAAVLVVWLFVRVRVGDMAGLLAALFLAITPVSVAVDRSNNTDSCLVLVLLLAAWAELRAIETARLWWLLAAFALLGLGFNIKMLAALVVAPGFVVLYGLMVDLPWRRRLAHLTLAGVVLAGVSLAWVGAYDLTPPAERPYVDSTQGNSMLELAIGHNGIQRFVRPPRAPRPAAAIAPVRLNPRNDAVPTGPLRLADRHLAEQVLWLLPLSLLGLYRGCRPIGGLPALGGAPAMVLLCGAWALLYGITYSVAGGIFHAYYLVTMAPPLAALAGIGVASLWHDRGRGGLLLPGILALAVLWQLYLLDPGRGGALRLSVAAMLLAGGLLASGAWLAAWRSRPQLAGGALALAVAALSVGPCVAASASILARGNATLPAAGVERLAQDGDPLRQRRPAENAASTDDPKLIDYLLDHSNGERFLVAAPNARLVAPIIVRTGMPAMAIGGFLGSDPIVTTEQLDALVQAGVLRFILLPDNVRGFRRDRRAELCRRRITKWALQRGVTVDPALWRSDRPGSRAVALIDLRPG
jgi:4-amino-4-deoxy-L-arabinose transferase-like glycosyltransferase